MYRFHLAWATTVDLLSRPFRSDGIIGALFATEPSVPGDDPTLQQLLMLSAVFCGPVMFFIGGMLFWVIPPEHVRTRTWSFWNASLSMATALWLIATTSSAINRSNRLPAIRVQNAPEHFSGELNHITFRNVTDVRKVHFEGNLNDFEVVHGSAEQIHIQLYDENTMILRTNSDGVSLIKTREPFGIEGGALIRAGFALSSNVTSRKPLTLSEATTSVCEDAHNDNACSNVISLESALAEHSFQIGVSCSGDELVVENFGNNSSDESFLKIIDSRGDQSPFRLAENYLQFITPTKMWCTIQLIAPDQHSLDLAFLDVLSS